MIEINTSPPIPALPRVEDKTKVDVRYALISPFANAHIFWDSEAGELVYELEEPILQEGQKQVLDQLEQENPVKYFPQWLEINQGLDPQPRLTFAPDSSHITYHWHDWNQPIFIPHQDDLGLRGPHLVHGDARVERPDRLADHRCHVHRIRGGSYHEVLKAPGDLRVRSVVLGLRRRRQTLAPDVSCNAHYGHP